MPGVRQGVDRQGESALAKVRRWTQCHLAVNLRASCGDDFWRVSEGVQDFVKMSWLDGLTPPASVDRFASDQLGNVWNRSTRQFQEHSLLEQHRHRLHRSHPAVCAAGQPPWCVVHRHVDDLPLVGTEVAARQRIARPDSPCAFRSEVDPASAVTVCPGATITPSFESSASRLSRVVHGDEGEPATGSTCYELRRPHRQRSPDGLAGGLGSVAGRTARVRAGWSTATCRRQGRCRLSSRRHHQVAAHVGDERDGERDHRRPARWR